MMDRNSNLIDSVTKVRPEVPQGYFEELRTRLGSIPESHSSERSSGVLADMKPYLALAASFVAIFIAGTMILRSTVGRIDENERFNDITDLYIADLS